MKILVIPTTDWLGHPFPSRLHHIFKRLAKNNEIHVLRFGLYNEKKIETQAVVHEIDDIRTKSLAPYYLVNAYKHHKAMRRIVEEYQINMVVISNLLVGYVAVRAIGEQTPMVFDLPDHFPSSGAGYYFNANSFFGKLAIFTLEKLLKKTLQRVERTVVCSHGLWNYVKKLGFDNVSLLTNGVDEFFLSQKHNGEEIRKKYGLNGYVTVGYIGSIEFWLNMPPLLKAIQQLVKDYNVKLFLVGTNLRTDTVQEVQKQIRILGIEKNVVWVNNFVPYDAVPKYIAAMDICTIPFNHNHPTANYSSPNKLWEYLALKKPVITTPVPDVIIQAERYINVAETARDYIKIIENYIKKPDNYDQKAGKGRKLAEKQTWAKIAERYEQLLISLAKYQKW